jgi:hypothetical protein
MIQLPTEIIDKITIEAGLRTALLLNNKYAIKKIKLNIIKKAYSAYDNVWIYILNHLSIYEIEYLLKDNFYIQEYRQLLKQPPIHLCDDIFDYLVVSKQYNKLKYCKDKLKMKIMITTKLCDNEDLLFIQEDLDLIKFMFHYITDKNRSKFT